MRPCDIAARCHRIRLPRKRLAELAKLDETTVGRTLNADTRPLQDTVEKMEAGMVGDEIDLLGHLVALYPQRALELATVALCPQQAPQREAAE